jgi:cytochrome c oxidase subunit 1
MDSRKLAPHGSEGGHSHGHDHHDDHANMHWIWKYVFSTDHKVIGCQYLLTALFFLLFGFMLMMFMRWQIAYPGEPLTWNNFTAKTGYYLSSAMAKITGQKAPEIPKAEVMKPLDPEQRKKMTFSQLLAERPWMEVFFGNASMPGGVMSPDFYNSLGAMHGTIMVFLAIVPLGFAAFGNYVMPLQIGAPDMCFPRINMASYWAFLAGGITMLVSFFVPGGAAKCGWTSYSPLANVADTPLTNKDIPVDWPALSSIIPFNWSVFLSGQTLWLVGMVLLITSSLLGSVNFIATIIQLRAKGMTWMRMPFFVWAQFVTGFLLLLAFPPLEAAGIMQLMDRVAGTSFFAPTGLVVGGEVMNQMSGGGTPLLWQHLFWFLGHPEVYVIILPILGAVCEIIACNTRKPIWGYKSMVYSILFLGFISFIVWAHHMYMTGMGTVVSAFFQATTIIISVPSVIIISALVISLWGGSIRFTVPMMWATAFLPMFGIGGLTGIPLAFNASDLYLHDTYYVIAHFHYIVAPGVIFGIFGGIYHWFPKVTGRKMSDFWGKVHFWPSFVAMNCIFMPMFFQGMAGMHRRWYDGGQSWELAKDFVHWNEFISFFALVLLIAQVPFIVNFFYSIWWGEKVTSDNPWHATTLEWATPTPPPHGNFLKDPVVDKGPYEYSVPGKTEDYCPQNANA